MNLDSGAQNPHQKDFIHTYFQSDPPRDAEFFHNHTQGPQATASMNFPHQPSAMSNMQMSVDVFQGLMNGQENSSQQGMPSPAQTSPQALMEQQMRLNQLQQLQQLQNQIFQQQLELLSGQNSFPSLPAPMDRPRDQQQYLPTPASSTELRAQPSPDFVSPMILHSNQAALANMAQNHAGVSNQGLSEYMQHHMMPTAPHSAPANLVFQPPLHLQSSTDLDFSDISPLTSPWLGAYNNQPASGPSSRGAASVSAAGSKRRIASSSGDESAMPAKPSRKRQSPAVRVTPKPAAPTKKTATRSTRSANSTPLFSGMSRPGVSSGGPNPADIPNDTPSPIELPPMPPPAHLPPSVSPSLHVLPISPVSCTSAITPIVSMPSTVSVPSTNITPVTPASIMNLGRLGIPNTSAPAQNSKDSSGTKKKDGTSKGKSSAKSGNTVESQRTTRMAEKASAVPMISPSLKPIRPAGNTPIIDSTSSAAGFAQPVMQVRKSSHKAAEQKRRDSLKTSFDDLRVLLPPIPLPSEEGFQDEPILPGAMPPRGPPKGNIEGPNRGVSKLQLLRCGNDYIRQLKGRVERRDDEIDKLRKEISRLRLFVSPDDAQAGEHIDLEKDLDAVETIGGGLFGRGQNYGGSVEGDDADEEAGES